MTISVNISKNLGDRFKSYVDAQGIEESTAIKKALELLLRHEEKSNWGNWMSKFTGDDSFTGAEEFRKELKAPNQDIF